MVVPTLPLSHSQRHSAHAHSPTALALALVSSASCPHPTPTPQNYEEAEKVLEESLALLTKRFKTTKHPLVAAGWCRASAVREAM